MKTAIALLSLIIYMQVAAAQSAYKVHSTILTNKVDSESDIDRVIFTYENDSVYTITERNKTASLKDVIVTKFDLHNTKALLSDTFTDIPGSFWIHTAVVKSGILFLCGSSQYMYARLGTTDTISISPPRSDIYLNTYPYSSGKFLNDSTVLLYNIYNYHPLDGRAGIFLYTLDLSTNKIVDSTFEKFPGIAMSHMAADWLAVRDEKIFIVQPLSGVLTVRDKHLKIVGSILLNLFNERERRRNNSYQTTLDSIIYGEHKRMNNLLVEIGGIDSVSRHHSRFSSRVYGKDFIGNTIHTTRDSFDFVENVINDGGDICFVINKHTTPRAKDLHFISTSTFRETKKILNWRVYPEDTVRKPEDLYVANVQVNPYKPPYFHNGYLYCITDVPFSENVKGPTTRILKEFAMKINKEEAKWSILKYTLP